MLIWMDAAAQEQAGWIAAHDQFMKNLQVSRADGATYSGAVKVGYKDTKKAAEGVKNWIANRFGSSQNTETTPTVSNPEEGTTDYNSQSSLTDSSVSLIGHTDGTGNVGEQTPEQIAANLAKRYKDNKEKLREVFLIACEAGHSTKRTLEFRGQNFAQRLSNALQAQGFDGVQVYAATPPKNAVATRVTINTRGEVNAESYLTKEATHFFDNQKRKPTADIEAAKKSLTTGETLNGEKLNNPTHKEKFRAYFVPHGPRPVEANYLNKLLANNGFLDSLFYAIFGDKYHAKKLLHKYVDVTQRSAIANNNLTELRRGATQIDSKSLTNYLNLDIDTPLPKRESLFTKFQTMVSKAKYVGHDATINQVSDLHEEICSIQKDRDAIKEELIRIMREYITKHQDNPSKASKVNVMEALLNYTECPIKNNWKAVEEATTTNPGWDKGFFDPVQTLKTQIEQTMEVDQSTEESTKKNTGGLTM